MSSENLTEAKRLKQDEFYTQLHDIDNELGHYEEYFRGKTVYCNCDDPRISNFFHYFSHGFEYLGLKKLITTCYKNQDFNLFSRCDTEQAIRLEYNGDKNDNKLPDVDEIGIFPLQCDGDFRSRECIELLKQADIVCTNPPFSLWRQYVAQLLEYDKKFLIIGNFNSITIKDVFPLIRDQKIWTGVSKRGMDFITSTNEKKSINACWFTNLDHKKRHNEFLMTERYSPDRYPPLDNYDAIAVGKTVDIPMDYDGVMAVPTSFLDHHNPKQFDILGITKAWNGNASKIYPRQVQVNRSGERKEVTKLNDCASFKIPGPIDKTYYEVDGNYYKGLYPRLLIQHRRPKK